MHRILMIEDEARIRAFVVPYLVMSGFDVDEAGDGESGLQMALSRKYSLILLDLMLPGIDGMTVCGEIRKASRVPILMLTAKGEEDDVVSGFESGADDYLIKPFSPKELVARVKALLARCSPAADDSVSYAGVSIDPSSQEVTLGGGPLSLTPKEFDLLLLLVRNPNRAFTREELLSQVWGYEFFGDTRTVDTHIKQLREKFGGKRGLIVTVWGKGYKLSTD